MSATSASARDATIFLIIGGIFGASGVALAAAEAHVAGGREVGTASRMLLFHAPAALALAAASRVGFGRGVRLFGWALLAGAALFSGDLAARSLLGDRLFAMAAPIGGLAMIAGWLGLAAAGAALAVSNWRAKRD